MSRAALAPRAARALLGAAGLALPAAAPALADRVSVKGVVLEGRVESITAERVVMSTVYGKGQLAIAVADVEAIETDDPFHVFHGDDVDTLGRVVGVSPDAIRIDAGGPEPTEVALPAVYAARRDPGPDADPIERAGVALAYWSGGFDLAVSAALATDDTLALGGDLGLLRQRGGSRLRLESGYRLAAQKLDGEPGETTQNEVRGLVRQELDLTPRLFAFGSADAEYDEIEELTIRTVPKLGLGTVLFESESLRLAVDGGGAYVYQRFFGGESERYPAAAFGAESDLKLPVAGASWRTRLDYTPSLTHWTDDWLLRAETSLLVPLASSLSFKASLLDLYNASPAEGTDENSLSTLLGLSVGF